MAAPDTTKKKSKRLRVQISSVKEDADHIAPVIGYFPSGYNPAKSTTEPEIRVFRNKKHKSSLDLVVKPQEAKNVEFVGTSYTGESAVHRTCCYALGVLDKNSGTLKVLPIASGKILRLEPRVMACPSAEETPKELEEKSARKFTDLTALYGTKGARILDKKRQKLRQQTNDPSAKELLQDEYLNAGIQDELLEDRKPAIYLNVPPHDLTANKPENAYILDEIIPRVEHNYLTDILDSLGSGAGEASSYWEENFYPSFVVNRVNKLKGIKDEAEKKKHASILSYITHLVNFWKLSGSRYPNPKLSSEAINKYKIPRVIFQRLVDLFIDPSSRVLSTQKKELIIGYILVLSLFSDKFTHNPADVSHDLGLSKQELKLYYKQLGCKSQSIGFAKYVWTLPVPLKFPDMAVKRRPMR